MNSLLSFLSHHFRAPARLLATGFVALALNAPAWASPGAHGPNGEHLDGPAQGNAMIGNSPRMEARSELFELVAQLYDGELSILINRYETNEPVLEGKVEVESGPLKAIAKFHADHGDYAVDDAALLKALSAPGEHALVFTIVAGSDSDLLNGSLQVRAPVAEPHGHDDHDHEHGLTRTALAAGLLGAGAIGLLAWRRRKNHSAHNVLAGGQQ